MTSYQNVNGDSNVQAYEIGNDFINIKFNGTEKIYQYSYQSAGKDNVEAMKKLAKDGKGLNSYVNKNVRNLYVK